MFRQRKGLSTKFRATAQWGFSTVELMVSIGIFLVLTSVIMVNSGGLSNRVNIDSIAHQMAQWVRDAQISSMGARRSVAGTFILGYGLHFETAQPNQFIYFADVNGDGIYAAGTDGIEKTVDLLQGYRISLLCGSHGGVTAASTCGGVTSSAATSVMDISFRRPYPDANIKGDSIGTSPAASVYSPARITVTSPQGLTRTIVVYVTGQVSIQ